MRHFSGSKHNTRMSNFRSLKSGRERNQMGETFQCHGPTVVDMLIEDFL